jgi:hypothetical protein
MTADDILNRAGKILHDETGVLWPKSTLLGHLNDGQNEIVGVRPESSTVMAVVQLEPGVKQTIPAGGIRIVDMIKNRVGV